MTPLDEPALQNWIGRSQRSEDLVTAQMLRAFRATFELETPADPQAPAPLGLHWCLSPPTVPMSEIGEDGHPKRGGFLPPVPLPRRMWAGGRLTFHQEIRPGEQVERLSTILSVKLKEGRTGPLCFVVVEHKFTGPRGAILVEEHDIVYRGLEAAAVGASSPETLPQPQAQRIISPGPVLLFRYSALTFNGHRIHYDRDYVTKIENYPGLIVHGPLQATLLLHMAQGLQPHRRLRSFSFRATRPLFDTQDFSANGLMTTSSDGRLWIASAAGLHMDAQANWA